jgi:hypothetical protein
MLVTRDVGRSSIVRVRITEQISQSSQKHRRECSDEIDRPSRQYVAKTNDLLTIRKHIGLMKSGNSESH